ncbi:AraC family transcriptional regulator [Flagellimonas hymeniacidonis]|uniref:AraC family transcriptional regulator n=1 Tax=Flagellimonas hymeniacidonis TaxID=2603628 RepID=A0A5C8V874_9FLAO|nr:AraC family transcriptional regulator [Flagellimonas hymeniacidonis]TXN38314.1 AraC family transcriptional regulator [Flagellimonas hymeniacidonis]
MNKPRLEEIRPQPQSSFYMLHQKRPTPRCFDFWHFHPEFELVYVPRGNGVRYIDTNISHFQNGDLFIIGPNIPHNTFYYGRTTDDSEQYIIQIGQEKIERIAETFKEFRQLKELLTAAETGICIEHGSKHDIGSLISEMMNRKPALRLLKLFEILGEIQRSPHKINLGAGKLVASTKGDMERIRKVLDIINDGYQNPISTRSVAKELSMTETSFCRFFVGTTGKTFKTMLNEFRIQRACNLLLNTNLKVNVISIRVGFNSIPHFYKSFNNVIATTPTLYRKKNLRKMRVP